MMPKYFYEALDASGAEVTDRVEAADAVEAIEGLRARGLTVTRLQLGGAPPGRRKGPPRWFWWVWSLMFLGLGGLFLYVLGVRPVWGVLQSSGWVETPCTVVSSQLKENNDSDEPDSTYSIDIKYKYEFGGAAHESDRYDFLGLSSNTHMAAKRRIVKEHRPGMKTICYVNPRNPAEAVLDRGWNSEMWWGLFPVPFVLAGACAFVFGALGWRPRRKQAVNPGDT